MFETLATGWAVIVCALNILIMIAIAFPEMRAK